MRPLELSVLPIYLAVRMVENRGGYATEFGDRLQIRRNGQFLGDPPIVDGCVKFMDICGVFAANRL